MKKITVFKGVTLGKTETIPSKETLDSVDLQILKEYKKSGLIFDYYITSQSKIYIKKTSKSEFQLIDLTK